MKKILFVMALSALSLLGMAGDEPRVKVISVIDGNTIEVLSNDGDRFRLFLRGIDSPDSGQNFSAEAKKFLEELILNRQVALVITGKDRYGTPLGLVRAEGLADPRLELVKAGLAWTTEQDVQLESLKEHARDQGLGLWIDENPMPPWLYRRHMSMMRSKGE